MSSDEEHRFQIEKLRIQIRSNIINSFAFSLMAIGLSGLVSILIQMLFTESFVMEKMWSITFIFLIIILIAYLSWVIISRHFIDEPFRRLEKDIIGEVTSNSQLGEESTSDNEDKDKRREYLFKEIEIIQDIIKRMASNSFKLKGWTVVLVVGTMLLEGTDIDVPIAFIPLVVFWFLDAYFLWQERMYRKLYNWVICNRQNTEKYLFNMDAYRFKDEVQSRFRIMFSTTLRWFYGSIALLIVIYLFLRFLI